MKKIFYVLSTIIFIHCANPVGPTGGDKDINAPIILKTKIQKENNLKKITLIFDENINTKGSVILSPITNKKNTELNKHRNTLWFYIPKETNSISLSDVITDVNENNPGRYASIILGNDSSKYIFNYKSLNPTKDKIKSYAIIDSFLYYGDNTKKGKIGIEGLKKQSQYIYTFNDINNNDKYDNNEDYNIQLIQTNELYNPNDSIKDTTNYYLYPSSLKEIKKSHLHKEGISIYTQVPRYFIQKEKRKEELYFLEHSDSMIIHTFDTTYLENQLKQTFSEVKFIDAKIDIKPSNKTEIKIGLFEKDTVILYEFNLGNYINKIQNKEIVLKNNIEIKSIKKQINTNTSIYNGSDIEKYENTIKSKTQNYLNNPNKRDSIIKKIKIKLGKTTLKNKNKINQLKIKLLLEGKTTAIENISNETTDLYLAAGNYKYIIWQDLNDNGEIDTKSNLKETIATKGSIEYEKIIDYMNETSVNSKLDNIIIVE